MTIGAFLLLSCLCASAAGEVLPSSLPSAKLNAVWRNVTITRLDPTTAVAGDVLLSPGPWRQPGVSPALDISSQRLFMPVYGPFSETALAVYDLSVPEKVTLLKTISIPGDIVYSIQYDAAADTVWMAARNLSGADDRFLVSVSLTSGSASTVTLPFGFRPVYQTGLGSSLVVDENNRELVLSVMKPVAPKSQDMAYSLLRFNLDTQQFTNISLPDLWPCAMVKDPQSGTVYAFFHPSNDRQKQLLSFGTLDTISGTPEVINKWTYPHLLFIINSLCAFDPELKQLYAVVGAGDGGLVALVTVSVTSGKLEHMAYFSNGIPQGLFVY